MPRGATDASPGCHFVEDQSAAHDRFVQTDRSRIRSGACEREDEAAAEIGPSVEDLADALGDQELTSSSESRPVSLDEYWMPFTPNRDFKADPNIIVRAEGMYYWTQDGRRILAPWPPSELLPGNRRDSQS